MEMVTTDHRHRCAQSVLLPGLSCSARSFTACRALNCRCAVLLTPLPIARHVLGTERFFLRSSAVECSRHNRTERAHHINPCRELRSKRSIFLHWGDHVTGRVTSWFRRTCPLPRRPITLAHVRTARSMTDSPVPRSHQLTQQRTVGATMLVALLVVALTAAPAGARYTDAVDPHPPADRCVG